MNYEVDQSIYLAKFLKHPEDYGFKLIEDFTYIRECTVSGKIGFSNKVELIISKVRDRYELMIQMILPSALTESTKLELIRNFFSDENKIKSCFIYKIFDDKILKESSN